jgi:uncharacterized RDD family membrane protein YckC
MTQSGAPPSFTTTLYAPTLIRRMACWLYEGMLLFGVMVTSGLAYFIAAYWFTGLAPGEMSIHPQLKSGLQAISFLVLGVYFTWFWHRGQTLAMKTWRIEIVDAMGQRLSRKTAFKRYLASWLWFIPPIAATAPLHLPAIEVALLTLGWVLVWALLSHFHPQRQFWHDAWAGTRLISVG